MSSHDDIVKLHHTQKDVERTLTKLAGQIKWVLLVASASLIISFLTFAVLLSK